MADRNGGERVGEGQGTVSYCSQHHCPATLQKPQQNKGKLGEEHAITYGFILSEDCLFFLNQPTRAPNNDKTSAGSAVAIVMVMVCTPCSPETTKRTKG